MAPWSIGNHVADYLRLRGYDVEQYQWDERRRINPISKNDLLLGHPHPEPGYVFELNAPRFRHFQSPVIAIQPWNGSDEYKQQLENVYQFCDELILICGPYWRNTLCMDPITHIDMAIDLEHYPFLKSPDDVSMPRKMVYIGCMVPHKGTDYLSAIAEAMPDIEFHHIGWGAIPHCHNWGIIDLASDKGREVIKQFTHLISCGRNDANPTTVLEAQAWGLIPMCTPRSGWNDVSVRLFPLDNIQEAVKTIRAYINEDIKFEELINNRDYIKRCYNFDSFSQKIIEVIDRRLHHV